MEIQISVRHDCKGVVKWYRGQVFRSFLLADGLMTTWNKKSKTLPVLLYRDTTTYWNEGEKTRLEGRRLKQVSIRWRNERGSARQTGRVQYCVKQSQKLSPCCPSWRNQSRKSCAVWIQRLDQPVAEASHKREAWQLERMKKPIAEPRNLPFLDPIFTKRSHLCSLSRRATARGMWPLCAHSLKVGTRMWMWFYDRVCRYKRRCDLPHKPTGQSSQGIEEFNVAQARVFLEMRCLKKFIEVERCCWWQRRKGSKEMLPLWRVFDSWYRLNYSYRKAWDSEMTWSTTS
jgi:hypothetical protein